MRIARLSLGIVLCATAVWAQPAPRAGAFDRLDPAGPAIAAAKKLDRQALFLRLGDLPGARQARSLELELRRNTSPLVRERFALDGDVTGDLEILAGRPALRRELFRMAAERGTTLRLTLALDGRAVREMTFADLVTASRRLQGDRLAPRALPSQVVDLSTPDADHGAGSAGHGLTSVSAAGWSYDPSCVADCNYAYNNCHDDDNLCVGCPSICGQEYQSCIQNCPQTCTEPANVYTTANSPQLVGLTYLGTGCYEDAFQTDFVTGSYYDLYYETYRFSNTRHTQHCDGSETTEEVDVSYQSGYCASQEPFSSCPYPSSYAPYGGC